MGNGIGISIGGDFLPLLLNAMGERLGWKGGRRSGSSGIYETGK